jgi:hypothetical protein
MMEKQNRDQLNGADGPAPLPPPPRFSLRDLKTGEIKRALSMTDQELVHYRALVQGQVDHLAAEQILATENLIGIRAFADVLDYEMDRRKASLISTVS